MGIWRELGTPIIFEAKNWDEAVSADEIRNLVGKVKPAKTRFIIAWNGITGKDKWENARDRNTKVTGDLKVASKVTIQYEMKAASIDVKEEKKAKGK